MISDQKAALTGALWSLVTVVGLGRLERPTSPLSGVRSNHLSYRPARPLYESPARNATPAGRKRPQSPSAPKPKRPKAQGPQERPKAPPGQSTRRETKAAASRIKEALTKPQVFQAIPEAPSRAPSTIILRKEVIQPQVPLRLPCYDFTPVIGHTVASALPKVKLPASGATNSHGVTGGVYKARERIHRGVLIHDY